MCNFSSFDNVEKPFFSSLEIGKLSISSDVTFERLAKEDVGISVNSLSPTNKQIITTCKQYILKFIKIIHFGLKVY